MVPLPKPYNLVSWPMRALVLLIAIGAALAVVGTWAAGVRMAKLITEIGVHKRAVENGKAQQAAEGGQPGIVYFENPGRPPVRATPPPAK